jgi:hypothetical protein
LTRLKDKKPEMRYGETCKKKYSTLKNFISCIEITRRRQKMKHDTLMIISVMGMLVCAAALVLLS